MDSCSQMLMNRFRALITDRKLTIYSLCHGMKDRLRSTGCPENVSLANIGYSTNTVAADHSSDHALLWSSGSTWRGCGK